MRSVGLRTLAALALSFGLLLVLFWHVEPDAVMRAIGAVDRSAAMVAFACVTASFLLAGLRYWIILRTFHQKVGLAPTIRANLVGLVGGLLFFQVIGQTLSRWVSLRRLGVSPSTVVVTSLYERSLALMLLLAAAVCGAAILYGGISVELQRESVALAKSLILIVASSAVVSLIVLRRPLRVLVRSIARGANWRAIALGALLTMLVHGAMLAAYLSLVLALAPTVPLAKLAAASVVIMLAASFPISFAGWGVRELGAVFAFGMVGITAGEALAVSVSIGVLSVLSIGVMGALIFLLPSRSGDRPAPRPDGTARMPHVDFTRFLFAATPIGIASLIMFHVWLPVDTGFVNVNLADPVALMGGILFLLYFRQFDLRDAFPHLLPAIVLATLLLLFGLVHGVLRFGYTEWAVVNRGVGWFFILGYIASGGILAATSRYAGFVTILKILVWVTAVIVAADLALIILRKLDVNTFLAVTPMRRLSGESGNPNAFAFQLLLVLTAAAVLSDRMQRTWKRDAMNSMLFAMLFIAIYLTQSRAALVALVAMALGAALAGYRRFGRLASGAALTAAILFVLPGIVSLVGTLGNSTDESASAVSSAAPARPVTRIDEVLNPVQGSGIKLSRPGSEAERLQSIKNGLRLFKERPVFGGGLGAGIYRSVSGGESPLVIHSVPVWVLAEFGLVGAAIFGALFLSIALSLWRQTQATGRPVYAFGLLMLLAFAVFGLPHDIFYQRLFWFLLGVMLFQGARLQRRTPGLSPSERATDATAPRPAPAQVAAAKVSRTSETVCTRQ